MREALKAQDLSFTELAKVIGERWQLLSPEAREEYELQASTAKEKYKSEFAEYKKTERYSLYQAYLAEFRAKQAAQPMGKSHYESLSRSMLTTIRSQACQT